MDSREAEFLKRLMATFKIEAEEHLHTLSTGLMRLERGLPPGEGRELIEEIFRDAHSLKGAARSVNLSEVSRLCHCLESVFSTWKSGESAPKPALFDALHRAVDFLRAGIYAIEPELEVRETSATALIRDVEAAAGGAGAAPIQAGPGASAPEANAAETAVELPSRPAAEHGGSVEGPGRSDTVRVSSSRLDAILLQAEELLSIKLASAQRAAELARLASELQEWGRNGSGFRVDEEHFRAFKHALNTLTRNADRDNRTFASILDALLGDIKQALMFPVSTVLDLLPKLVRDLARDQGKEIDLVIEGGQIEVDRRVLDEMRDPVIHLVRNSIDHGIESPARRRELGKPPRGSIALTIAQRENNRVELRIQDDGHGFDLDGLRAAALKSGAVSAQSIAGISARDLAMLAFHSGVSTSPMITDVSGRGLGLAIVQNKVNRLGGVLSLQAEPGRGSTIGILLPVTLATFRGILVRVSERTFVLPTFNVERVVRVPQDAIESVEGREILLVHGEKVSLARLADVLDLPRKRPLEGEGRLPCAIIVRSTAGRLALLVDDVSAEQEVLVKSLGRQLARVKHVIGAALLGTGSLAPILYVPDLIHTAIAAPFGGMQAGEREQEADGQTDWRILLAEDSITARALLKSILETAGYTVFVAVDGAEALATLRTTEVDLVVSDVEMPRLNGFDLTAKIRADRRLSEIPVVLVTALESREDRERGIEAGANAYIIKSSFDQSNLLETIRQLL